MTNARLAQQSIRRLVAERDAQAAEIERLRGENDQLRVIAHLILTAFNHPSGTFGEEEAEQAADLAADFLHPAPEGTQREETP